MLKFVQFSCQELSNLSKLSRLVTPGSISRSKVTSATAKQPLTPTNDEERDTGGDGPASQKAEGVSSTPQPSQTYQSPKTPYRNQMEENFAPYRYIYPEFLPHPEIKWRNKIKEKLERMDMMKRRGNIEIPEFYVGSILSVTTSDNNAPGKTNTFVGICTEREHTGLNATFVLRNIVDGHGVEIIYSMYSPTILNITCLRLEKRLDENLRYLRDCPPEYSTVPFDMVPELRNPDAPVPINPIKVKLNPKPWTARWQLWELKGVEDLTPLLTFHDKYKKVRWSTTGGYESFPYDLMRTYRESIPMEEQTAIYGEVHQQLAKMTASLRKQKKKRVFVKPQKTV